MPFFSVVIPTRNRPDLLVSAVESVMMQTHDDFEVIVSDNSTSKAAITQNLNTMSKWAGLSKVKYIRPDHPMDMADHWEFATRNARGQYVAILTDRFVMRPSTLKILQQSINLYQDISIDCVVWNVGSVYEAKSGIAKSPVLTGKKTIMQASDILQDWLKMSAWKSGGLYSNLIPRGLNSIYASSLAARVRELHGRFFWRMSPDYTAGFLSLAYAKTVLSIDLPLYMSHGRQSNGRKSLVWGIDYSEFPEMKNNVFCPIQLNTVFNAVVHDFNFVKSIAGERLSGFDINLAGYCLSLYKDLILKEQLGSPMNLKELYAAWHEQVRLLHPDVQKQIYAGVKILDRQHPKFIWARRMAVQYGLNEKYRDMLWRLRGIRQSLSGKTRHKNVLDAVRNTDYLIREVQGD